MIPYQKEKYNFLIGFGGGSQLGHVSCSVNQSCSCQGGYVNGNYDSCLTGHNTCQGGYKSCWHY